MRRTILTAVFSLMICMVLGQSFPGNNPELLLNKEVKPKERVDEYFQERGYRNFFLEYKSFMRQFLSSTENKPFFIGSEKSPRSAYTKLVGKKFMVLEVFEIGGNEFGLKLENPEIGIIYYKYNPEREYEFELEVIGKLDFPDNYFCSQIEYEKDKFENDERYYTPIQSGINFVKLIKNGGKPTYYLSVLLGSHNLNYDGKGLYILFEDGSKFSKSNAIYKVELIKTDWYRYFVFETLTANDLKMFSEKIITDVRVFINDNTVDKESALKIREYAKCLLK